MKKVIILACSCFLLAACGNSAKTNNSTSADSTATQVADIHNAETSLDYEGTYKGVFPAADCPGIKTVLTLNADSTYQYSADYLERKDGHDEASGIFKVLANNVVAITRPSSGETSYYKVKDANSLIMTDSLGNSALNRICLSLSLSY